MRYVRAFLRFWYEFLVGDDWRIAAGVVAVLAIGAIAVGIGATGAGVPLVLFAGLILVLAGPLLIDRARDGRP